MEQWVDYIWRSVIDVYGQRWIKEEQIMNSKVELLKEMDPKKVEAWDKLHDKRKVYRCERCGAEWKCEYADNKFGNIYANNGDSDILCQCCGFSTVKEVKEYDTYPEDLPKSCVNCKYFNGWAAPSGCERTPGNVVAVSNPRQYYCDDFSTGIIQF